MAKYFSHWLPRGQQRMMATAGYFSYKVGLSTLSLDFGQTLFFYLCQISAGLTVISLNSNFCNNLNLWLLPSPRDPTNQLLWLYHQLVQAEVSHSKVHIISHIPPGSSSCLSKYKLSLIRFHNLSPAHNSSPERRVIQFLSWTTS